MQCLICGNIIKNKPIEKYQTYHLYHCSNCDIQFWYPTKAPGSDWYSNYYPRFFKFGISKPSLDPAGKLILKNLPFKRGAILDVGCGMGGFIGSCLEAGYQAIGIDFQNWCIDIAKKYFGEENFYCINIKDFHPQDKFDLITFFEVLEHIDNPSEFLEQVKSLLKPGGYIGLSTPNRERSPNLKELWDYPPHHLTRWNKEALKKFLESNGFGIIKLKSAESIIDALAYTIYNIVNKYHFYNKSKNILNSVLSFSRDRQDGNNQDRMRQRRTFLRKIILKTIAIILSPLFSPFYRPRAWTLIARLKNNL